VPYRNITLQELARHLGMDARQVKRLADRGILPGRYVGGQWRFNRAQMLDWLQREMHGLDPCHIRSLERAMADGRDDVLLGSLIAPEAIEPFLPARTRPSVLRQLVALAERTGLVYDRDEIIRHLEEREAQASTALAGGFAFPHPRHPLPYATAEPLVCVGRAPAGIPYGAPDGNLTYIFVLVCSHEDRAHLQVLARLSLLFRGGLADELMRIDDAEQALSLILQREQELLARRR